MFNGIGRKIKGMAVFVIVAGIICSIIGAISYWGNGGVLAGFMVLIVGICASVITSFLLYGFGELIIKVDSIDEQVKELRAIEVEQTDNVDAISAVTRKVHDIMVSNLDKKQ